MRARLERIADPFAFLSEPIRPLADKGRVRARAALRNLSDAWRGSSRFEHAVLDNMAEGVILVDEQGRVALWNHAAETILRMPAPDHAYDAWLSRVSMFGPDELTELARERTPLARALRGEWVDREQVFVRHDQLPEGVWVSVNARPLAEGDGAPHGAVAVFRDVTEEHAAQLAALRAQRDLRRVIESSPEGIAVVRGDRWILVNRAMARSLGYASPHELVGRQRSEIVHPDDLHHGERRKAQLAATGEPPDEYEVRYRRANGDYAVMEVSLANLTEFEGAPAVLLMARDVTERKRLHTQLRMSERLVSVGTLAAGVAHEINSPLAAVIGHVDWLSARLERMQRETASPELGLLLEPVREAKEAAERMRTIVRDLKLFSRAEEELLGPVDLVRVLDSASRLAWHEIRHRARFVKDYRELPPAFGNEARLGQVILNLLVNAAQAIVEGQAERNEIRLSARADGQRIVVEVRDTGQGIPEEIAARIFEPFFTTKPKEIGTGLGLAICQRIVADYGGQIEVFSAEGAGSSFRVVLCAAQEPLAAADATPPPAPAVRRGRVLVIDDDPAIGSTLRLILSEWHEVVALTDAREALRRLYDGECYDVILCDVMMPDMTAMDLHAELATSLPEIARELVFLTGGAFTVTAREFLDRVPNARFDKPFDLQQLVSLVNERVAGGESRAQAG